LDRPTYDRRPRADNIEYDLAEVLACLCAAAASRKVETDSINGTMAI
jgi:hypothetical protein